MSTMMTRRTAAQAVALSADFERGYVPMLIRLSLPLISSPQPYTGRSNIVVIREFRDASVLINRNIESAQIFDGLFARARGLYLML